MPPTLVAVAASYAIDVAEPTNSAAGGCSADGTRKLFHEYSLRRGDAAQQVMRCRHLGIRLLTPCVRTRNSSKKCTR